MHETQFSLPLPVFSPVPSIIGVVIAVLVLVAMILGFSWYFRSKKALFFSRSSTNSSFENPYFAQEVTMSHLQVRQTLSQIVLYFL